MSGPLLLLLFSIPQSVNSRLFYEGSYILRTIIWHTKDFKNNGMCHTKISSSLAKFNEIGWPVIDKYRMQYTGISAGSIRNLNVD